MLTTRTVALASSFCTLAAAVAASAAAKDVFLTIGGGYSPKGNQVSLEKNVLFFQKLLAQERPDGPQHDIYFADGDDPTRDLQFSNAEALPAANWLMAELFGKHDYIDLEYRNHEVPGVHGKTSKKNLEEWFRETGGQLEAGDRVIIYATAHGGRSRDNKQPFNTRLYLWDDESIAASDLAKLIERLPEGVQVVLVMVQCYSGGFASLIFNEANQEKGATDRDYCGLFATVHDRVAAGCTADIDEDNYQEYSSFFWAALGGRSRTGQPVDRPDYNGDGETSFAEAHAYVMLHSDTIDIPIKTSGAFLRAYSKLRSKEHPELLSENTSYEDLLSLATPADAAVLEGLSAQLELTAEARGRAAAKLADDLEKQREELANQVTQKERKHRELKREIARDLQQRWPELQNVLSATATTLLTARAAEFEQAVLSHEQYNEFKCLGEEIASLKNERFELERKWVKCRRLERVLANVALAQNLPVVASPETVRRFERLIAAEEGTLHRAGTVVPVSPEVCER